MARIKKGAVRESSKEEWVAAIAAEAIPNPPPRVAVAEFSENEMVAYRGKKYSVECQRGDVVHISGHGRVFGVPSALLVRITRGTLKETEKSTRKAIRATAAADPAQRLKEEVKDRVRQALEGASTRKEFIQAGEALGVLDSTLYQYIDELDWGSANPGILRMRWGNILRGRLMNKRKV